MDHLTVLICIILSSVILVLLLGLTHQTLTDSPSPLYQLLQYQTYINTSIPNAISPIAPPVAPSAITRIPEDPLSAAVHFPSCS